MPIPTTDPEGPAAPFKTFLDESDRGWNGVLGLPNHWRNGPNGEEIPVDPEAAQSGGLSAAPGTPDAAPGNASPVKFDR